MFVILLACSVKPLPFNIVTSAENPDSGFNDFLRYGTVPVVGIEFRTRGHVCLGSRSKPQVAGREDPKAWINKIYG